MDITTSLYHLVANISTENELLCEYLCQIGFLELIFDYFSDLRYSIENTDSIINEDSLDQEFNGNNIIESN